MPDKIKNSLLVSFIIPTYNAVDTIERCLNSIYVLPLKRDEFEVIVIDDASSDDTCDVIERYVRDVLCMMPNVCTNNFTLLRQAENHRQGAARNRGVKVAKGEYICFVDSDDVVTDGIVYAIQISKEQNVDMVAYHYGNANENGVMTLEAEHLSFAESQIFTGIEMQNTHPYWSSAPWPYVYRKDFLRKVDYSFAEDVLYEDADFVVAHLYHAQRVMYSPCLGYIAYYREGSTTHSNNYKNATDYLFLGTRMLAFYEKIMYERLMNEEMDKFAEGILEGACNNIEKACRYLMKLDALKAVRAFYNRVDAYVNRHVLYSDKRLHKYYWNTWTTLCIKYKCIAIMVLAFSIPMYKMYKLLKW